MDSEAEADIEKAIELGMNRAELEQVIEQVKSQRIRLKRVWNSSA